MSNKRAGMQVRYNSLEETQETARLFFEKGRGINACVGNQAAGGIGGMGRAGTGVPEQWAVDDGQSPLWGRLCTI